MLRALFWISEVIIVALVLIPVIRFLLYQWGTRKQEFVNRLSGKPLAFYLSRFHGQSSADASAEAASRFDSIYSRAVGRYL